MDLLTVTKEIAPKGKAYLVVRQGPGGAALEEALQNGSIMGAAIDVFPKEPLTKEDAVVQLDNCTLTNHRGGDTLDSYERSPELLLEQLQEAVQTGHTKYMI